MIRTFFPAWYANTTFMQWLRKRQNLHSVFYVAFVHINNKLPSKVRCGCGLSKANTKSAYKQSRPCMLCRSN